MSTQTVYSHLPGLLSLVVLILLEFLRFSFRICCKVPPVQEPHLKLGIHRSGFIRGLYSLQLCCAVHLYGVMTRVLYNLYSV